MRYVNMMRRSSAKSPKASASTQTDAEGYENFVPAQWRFDATSPAASRSVSTQWGSRPPSGRGLGSPTQCAESLAVPSIRIVDNDEVDREVDEIKHKLNAVTSERNALRVENANLKEQLSEQQAIFSEEPLNLSRTRSITNTVDLAQNTGEGLADHAEYVKSIYNKLLASMAARLRLEREKNLMHRRFAAERQMHTENLERAMAVIAEQDEVLKRTEEHLLYESCLKDVRHGAKYTDTGAKFYKKKRAVSN